MPNGAWPTIEPTHIVGSPVTMVPPSEVGVCALERYFRISISVDKPDREIELERSYGRIFGDVAPLPLWSLWRAICMDFDGSLCILAVRFPVYFGRGGVTG